MVGNLTSPLAVPADPNDESETLIPVMNEEAIERRNTSVMDISENGITEFWPIEHPIEPSDEDRPVKCPMPESSDGQMRQEWFSDSLRRRSNVSAVMNADGMMVVAAAEVLPARAVRKRHHTSTHHGGGGGGYHTLTPALRMPPLRPLPTQNTTILQMLQQLNKFES